MKLFLAIVLMASPLLGSCTQSLDNVVQERQFQRMAAASADKPVNAGAGDGVGKYIAAADVRLTLSEGEP